MEEEYYTFDINVILNLRCSISKDVMSTGVKEMKGRLLYFDSLRGIGCLIVLITHIIATDAVIGGYVSGCGKIGVWLFMLLSGLFLILPMTSAEKVFSYKEIPGYYENKIVRLYPAFLVSVVIGALMGRLDQQQIADLLLFRSAYGHFWYMPVILVFYCVAPVFLYFFSILKRKRMGKQLFAIIVVCLIATDILLFPYSRYPENSIEVKWYLCVFLIGILLGLAFPYLSKIEDRRFDWLVIIGTGMILIRTPLARQVLWGYPPSGFLQNKYFYMSVSWLIVIIGVTSGKYCKHILEKTRFLQWIGSISYEIYLIHFLILHTLKSHSSANTIIIGIVTIIVSLAVSWVVHRSYVLYSQRVGIHVRLVLVILALILLLVTTGTIKRKIPEDEESRLYVPTYITKINDDYFIVDCWHHRVIYSDSLKTPLNQWNTLTGDDYIGGHSVCSDGELLVLDNTDNSEVLVYALTDHKHEYCKQQVFENITGRPHFVTYDENNRLFYVIASTESQIYVFRNENGVLELERIETLPELAGSYVRSISVIGEELYTVSGPKSICRYKIEEERFVFLSSYPVPDRIAGMNQITKIGEWYYITVNTDVNGSVGAATILRVKQLEDLETEKCEELYEQMGFVGQPYYISHFDSRYFITEISADRGNGIRTFKIVNDQVRGVKPLFFWEDVTEESRAIYNERESKKPISMGELVDIFIFSGQSNMAGKGESGKAPIASRGMEFRAISDPQILYPAEEPFGVLENQQGGIDHTINGVPAKTGGLVTSFMNAYTSVCNVPIIGISASEGNTTISQWLPGTERYCDMINRIHLAKTFLANHPEYTLRRICFVWCQGESDGDIGTTEGEYEQRLEELKRGLTDEGVSAFFIISIGEKTGKTPNDYKNIRSAQEHFCMVNGKCTLVSSFYGLSGYMKDEYHYTQECYNMVGTEAGEKSGLVLLN